jgi:hypothetical protein
MRTRLVYLGLLVAIITVEIAWTGAIVFGVGKLLGFEM